MKDLKREFRCEKCAKEFKFKNVLKNHEREVHQNERNHYCDLCKRYFGRRYVLNQHVKKVHSKNKDF